MTYRDDLHGPAMPPKVRKAIQADLDAEAEADWAAQMARQRRDWEARAEPAAEEEFDADYTPGEAGLEPHQWRDVADHLAQTYSMNFGFIERAEANYFRLPHGDPAVIRTEPEAVLLRELAAAARKGRVRLRVKGMRKASRYRMSALLWQSANRLAVADDVRDRPVADQLAAMAREWDKLAWVRGTEEEKAARMSGWKG